MKYISVCSGIEAATAAWHSLVWSPVAFSEIEPFPCSVLAHHYPDVPNLGDMTKYKEWPNYDAIDILVGGTPCQSFSVAGLRKGLADPRGNLMLTYLAIAARYKPRYIVWENVPGILSSNGGRDFGTFLAGLAELGYGYAYRVLDAQYVRTREFPGAVPQRRRRVFVIGHLGDWRRAAAVLFDGASLRGDSPPSREAGKGVAGGFETGPTGGRFTDVAPTMDCRAKDGPIRNQLGVGAIAPAITGNPYGDHESREGLLIPAVAGTFTAGAHSCGNHGDSPHQGHLVPVAIRTAQTSSNGCGIDESGTSYTMDGAQGQAVAVPVYGFGGESDAPSLSGAGNVQPPITCRHGAPGFVAAPVSVFDPNQITSKTNRSVPTPGVCHTLPGTANAPVAFNGDVARTLNARHDSSPCADRGMDVVAVAGTMKSCSQNKSKKDLTHNAENDTLLLQPLERKVQHGDATETDARKILFVLRKAYGAEAYEQWKTSILASFQPSEVLRQALHGALLDAEALARNDDSQRKIEGAEAQGCGAVRSMRRSGCAGRSPQGPEHEQQHAGQSSEDLPFMSQPDSPEGQDVQGVWQTEQGSRILREALSAIQEVRRSAHVQAQPAYPAMQVRRLTPKEAERLQGFPDDYTAVPYRNRPACDGPRYKALGNSMAVNVMQWIGQRIAHIEEGGDQ